LAFHCDVGCIYDVGMAPKKKTKLSKSDPDFYSKIGKISAKKRKIPREQFVAWAKKSHKNRAKKKAAKKSGTKVA